MPQPHDHDCCVSSAQSRPAREPSSLGTADEHGYALTLRSGVVFPDWSAIKSENAGNALKAMFDVAEERAKLTGIGKTEDVVWRAVLELYARLGHAPTRRQLAEATALLPDVVAETLQDLHTRDLVVLDAAGSLIGAYPFTESPTEHLVHLGDHTLTAMCAVDALGAGAMYRQDTRIESACRHCGRKIEVTTREAGAALAAVSPPTAVVWSGIHYADKCAANSLCTVLAFFCSDDHLEAWRSGPGRAVPGFRLSMDEGLQLGKAIFVPRVRVAEPATASGKVS